MKELLTTGGVGDAIAFTQAERLQQLFERIDPLLQKKSLSSFGSDHVLVVCFDDFRWFGIEEENDLAALRSFVTAHLPSWGLNVGTLYIVGISGRTFLSFPTSGR